MFKEYGDFHLGLYHELDLDNPTSVPGLSVQQLYRPMDIREADRTWLLLKATVQRVLKGRYSQIKFKELHRLGYDLVTHNFGMFLHSNLEGVITDHVTSKVRQKVLNNLNNNFLEFIISAWDRHQTGMETISNIFMYMDEFYLVQNGMDSIYTLGLKLFRDLVLCHERIERFLKMALLELVMQERQGQWVDRTAFRKATKLLVEIDNVGKGSTNLFKELFEDPFLQQSTEFFKIESQLLLEKYDVFLYLKHVNKRIYEEIERSEQCYEETVGKITKIVEDELISANMKTVLEKESGVVFMLDNHQTEGLSCLYSLLSKVSNGLDILFDSVCSYLLREGEIIVKNYNSSAVDFIQILIDLKDNIDLYVSDCFSNNNLCKIKIASTFQQILNLNQKSAEYLSGYIDEKLKKNMKGMTDEDKAVLTDKAMALFGYLQNKDIFLTYYKQDLAKRLIVSKSTNEENETLIVNILKIECGSQYTAPLEVMLKDILLSSKHCEDFREHAADSGDVTKGITIKMKVLNSLHWPFQKTSPSCIIPSVPLAAFQKFKQFYLSRHCGRTLELWPQLGSAELEVSFLQPEAKEQNKIFLKEATCSLHVTTFQMCVLMKFNESSEWSFQDLLDETNIPMKDLKKALHSLVLGKPSQRVLNKVPESTAIEVSDHFFVNNEFSPKTNRIKIPALIQVKYEVESDKQDTIKRINESRNYEIEAAIMRIMKARRSIHHVDLEQELVSVLSHRFTPLKDAIKTRIEALIQREYIKRHIEDRSAYIYIA